MNIYKKYIIIIMQEKRKFRIIVNSKEYGTCSGLSPSAVAKKVVKKLCGKSCDTVKFSLKECKRGNERIFSYQGRMEKLERPYKRDGKIITHRVVCGKIYKMRGGERKLVLILCHPKPVTGTFYPDYQLNNHWWGGYDGKKNIYKRLFEEYGLIGEPIFETIDVKQGGTYVADAFSDEFINSNINKYDLVMVPDCGGQWYEYQSDINGNLSEDEKNTRKSFLIALCINLTKVVKNGGIICFSKFMNKSSCIIEGRKYDTFSQALVFYLNQNGFNCKIILIKLMTQGEVDEYIIASKKHVTLPNIDPRLLEN
jgi:hypothetical protein